MSKVHVLFTIIRIVAVFLLIFLILSTIYKPAISNFIAVPLVIVVGFSAFIGRFITFGAGRMSRLGFVTEVTCICGVMLMMLSAVLKIGFLPVGAFVAFGLAPLLGIINRAIKLKRGKVENIGYTIAEAAILGISVILVTLMFLKLSFV
jgi:hypothetical protein